MVAKFNIVKNCPLRIFIWILTACPVFSEEEQILHIAQQLSEIQAYNEAITEYKRYIFFNSDSLSIDVKLTIADHYLHLRKYQDAKNTLVPILSENRNDTVGDMIRIKIAVISIAQGLLSDAELELVRVSSFSRSNQIRNEANSILFIAFVFDSRWEKAQAVLKNNPDFVNGYNLKKTDSILNICRHKSKKMPVIAQWLSTFLPGLGQLYSRDYLNAANALAISLITGYMTINSLYNGYYQEAILTDITLLWRYYNGNRVKAYNIAKTLLDNEDLAYQKKITDILKNSEENHETSFTTILDSSE
ncbi:MAG TPA: hypothetical protein DCO75_12635 [Fibrobacteres bacterium]|nr:hypothetical protein [Fibrobacterota bacterium]